MARTFAQATTDKPLPPREGRPPLEEMFRLGAVSAGNLIASVVGGARSSVRVARAPAAGTSTPPTSGSATGARPRVTAGSTLRIPLLVENSSAAATDEVAFVVRTIGRADGPHDPLLGLDVSAVSFSPERLVIGPRDFEKLTVRIMTSAAAAAGSYRAVIVGGDGWFSTEIEFDVLAPGLASG